jgi:hypothetical protein
VATALTQVAIPQGTTEVLSNKLLDDLIFAFIKPNA